MNCPYCSSTNSRVTNKRPSTDGIRRRRECLKCKKRFTTYEKISNESIHVIKKDGSRDKFAREKLEKGIERAFEKRPIENRKIEKMISEIEEQIRKRGKREIKSSAIGEIIMKKIKRVDNVAYIRFASVYKNFQDVGDFKEAIKEVKL